MRLLLRSHHHHHQLLRRVGACAAASRASFASSAGDAVHVPVLLEETLALWAGGDHHGNSSPVFVDGTAGFGGHSRALLTRHTDARLLCVDRDAEVLAVARANLREFGDRVRFQQGSYADVTQHLAAAGFSAAEGVAGALVDLGANSFHFDEARRGFSLQHDGPLDMRFDQRDGGRTAADVLNTHSEVQLTKIFRDLGEERLAKEFAKAVVRDRDEKQLTFRTTRDLKECIERIARKWQRDSSRPAGRKGGAKSKATTAHPATRCFQALRIYVNEELQHVEDGLHALVDQLAPGGRLVTIAFHSLEDRPIKTLFRELDKHGRSDKDADDLFEFDEFDDDDDNEQPAQAKRFRLVRRKATKPTVEEMAVNPRSRSARLRCLERVQ